MRPEVRDDVERVWHAEYRRVVGVLVLHTGAPDVAEDLAQEAFARLCRHWPVDEPRAWLLRVAVNLATSRWRRLSYERRARQQLDATLEQTPDHGAGTPLALVLRQAVVELPLRQRSVVALRFYLDLSVDDTAQTLQMAPGTVKSTTSQALTRLRRDPRLWPLLPEPTREDQHV